MGVAADRAGLPALPRLTRRRQLASLHDLHRCRAVARSEGREPRPETARPEPLGVPRRQSRTGRPIDRSRRRSRLDAPVPRIPSARRRSRPLRRLPHQHRRLRSRTRRRRLMTRRSTGLDDFSRRPCGSGLRAVESRQRRTGVEGRGGGADPRPGRGMVGARGVLQRDRAGFCVLAADPGGVCRPGPHGGDGGAHDDRSQR